MILRDIYHLDLIEYWIYTRLITIYKMIRRTNSELYKQESRARNQFCFGCMSQSSFPYEKNRISNIQNPASKLSSHYTCVIIQFMNNSTACNVFWFYFHFRSLFTLASAKLLNLQITTSRSMLPIAKTWLSERFNVSMCTIKSNWLSFWVLFDIISGYKIRAVRIINECGISLCLHILRIFHYIFHTFFARF